MATDEPKTMQILEQIGSRFAEATGQSISFISRCGDWTHSLNLESFTGFCRYVITSEEGRRLCRECNSAFDRTRGGHIDVSQCHMGVSVVSVPVRPKEDNDLILSYGQFLLDTTKRAFFEALPRNSQRLGLDFGRLKSLAGELRSFTKAELADRIELLKLFSHYVNVTENQLQARDEYYRECRQKLELENRLSSLESRRARDSLNGAFLADALEAVLLTACAERAQRTSDLVLELLTLLRASLAQSPTRQEEAEFGESLRRLQRTVARIRGPEPDAAAQGDHRAVIQAVTIIRARYAQNLTLPSVARELYLTPVYLSRLFVRQTGVHFKEYLIRVRMERAQELLANEGLTVGEAAQAVGYNDVGYFSRSFKKYFGHTPREEANRLKNCEKVNFTPDNR